MELPGGLQRDGGLRRDYRFRTLTGELERALSESGETARTLPQQVTSILASSLLEVGGAAADLALVRSLSAGDRQFLVLQLAALLDPTPRWITTPCSACAEPIQFQVEPLAVPFKPAGEGYPATTLSLSIGDVRVRVPNGADEEYISLCGGDADTQLAALLSRLSDTRPRTIDPMSLSGDDLAAIDAAIDAMSAQAGLAASIACPHCGTAQSAAVDPYAWIVRDTLGLDEDIHRIATHYHWSEKEILQLPRSRRERYLHLIDRSLGRYRADDLIHAVHGSQR
jgi:hypothetical protein